MGNDRFDRDLHRAIGMSDLASLMAAGFAFPEDGGLAVALADGSFLSDWHASWEDACGENSVEEALMTRCADEFLHADKSTMRRGYSRMFLAPGFEVPVWPYESAFLHDEAGETDIPNLFRTRATVDVEHQMADAGRIALTMNPS